MECVVETIGERCKRCYHCVRHCPARAIRVENGQATVVEERCIGCGNCFRVCAQNAKKIRSSVGIVEGFLRGPGEVVAALAPSFPAAFFPMRPGQVVAACRALGFTRVVEVAFGADLVARRYRQLVAQSPTPHLIASPCPALVSYVEKFHPDLVSRLAPVVSPFIALGRALKQKHWPDARIVFIGPCTAKKLEMDVPGVAGAIDAVLTFSGFREMLDHFDLDLAMMADSESDEPRAGLGRVFPVTGGLLKTAALQQDVLDNRILVTEGMDRVRRLLKEVETGKVEAEFLDLLFCEGCIGGPVMTADAGDFSRKEVVTDYVKSAPHRDPEEYEAFIATYDDVDLSRTFEAQPVEPPLPTEEEVRAVLAQVNKFTVEDELNCGACGYETCRDKAIAVCQGLAEVEMCLPYLIEETQKALEEIRNSHVALAGAQERLVQAEKLAAVGQLAAGVAHQVNNPLSTVLLYAHLVLRQLQSGDPRREDLEVVVNEANRCKNIVWALLNFARQDRLHLNTCNLSELLDGLLDGEKVKVNGLQVVREYAADVPIVRADCDQLVQVFGNIVDNALDALGGQGTLTVRTYLRDADTVAIEFRDTGPGIPADALPRLFDPFFTTKPMGQGTGLGLAIARGIVKMHHGDIVAANPPGGGALFTVTLPLEPPVEEKPAEMIG
jgi:signal transduction histidine kinase/iron only hydrogenase large subunit-like protein